MKVLLIKDVYKLGHAGDVKKVADGYGRNFLIPQGLAILATAGALKQAEGIRSKADEKRAILNKEMSSVAEVLSKLILPFSAKAGETGKLYGSITPQMIIEAVKEKSGVELNRRQLDFQPIRELGKHRVGVRLTVDLVPQISVVVYREGEALEAESQEILEEPEIQTAPAGTMAEPQAELEVSSDSQEVDTAE
jgi:large subunit ribosomal protein L9